MAYKVGVNQFCRDGDMWIATAPDGTVMGRFALGKDARAFLENIKNGGSGDRPAARAHDPKYPAPYRPARRFKMGEPHPEFENYIRTFKQAFALEQKLKKSGWIGDQSIEHAGVVWFRDPVNGRSCFMYVGNRAKDRFFVWGYDSREEKDRVPPEFFENLVADVSIE